VKFLSVDLTLILLSWRIWWACKQMADGI